MIQFHVHTVYSFLDGYSKINDLINRAKELNMGAIAITDHGTLAGTFDFNKECKKNNIKPILGCEVYHTHDRHMISKPIDERKDIAWNNFLIDNPLSEEDIKSLKKKEREELAKPYLYDTKGYHLVLLAKNQTGWNNLIKLTSIANDESCYNGHGHVDNELLREYSEGIICLTACISGMVPHFIRKGELDRAKDELEKLKDIFKDDLYLEIQPLNWDEQYRVNKELIKLSREYNIKLIATNDVHYTNEADNYEHDVLLCIGTGKTLDDSERMKYDHEYWLRSEQEMIDAFFRKEYDTFETSLIINAIEETDRLSDKIEDNIQVGSEHELLPNVEVPDGHTPESWLKRQCWTKLYSYLLDNNLWDKKKIYEARLKHELNIITKKGFSSYILIVQDAINWGDANECPFGPGRGSGAGSLVLFLLGIIKGTDPVEYKLLFSRFLTMDRKLAPDIDSDVSKADRQRLIHYLDDKYGHSNTSQVGTLTLLGVKNGIKDIMRVFDYSFSESNSVTKELNEISDEPSLSFKHLDAMEATNPSAYKRFKDLEDKYQEVFALARKFEGVPRNYSVHAGGVLITPTPINDTFPTRTVDGKKVTVWDKDVVEKAGGIKYDFLGLATVSVIDLCLKFIKKNHDIDLSLLDLYNNLDIRNDPNVFKMLKEQKGEGVFQFESNLFKSLMRDIQPDNINDCIAMTALGRPGPMSANMHTSYGNRKNGVEPITYPLGLNELLEETYGTICYQEQIMNISQIVAGFDDTQADSYLRSGLAKKKADKIALCKEWFIYGKPQEDEYGSAILGGINNGYDEKELTDFWNDIEGYSTYLFNKSHATSYSLISCITAWLKYYFPEEYFAAHLTYLNDEKKIPMYSDVLKKEFNITLTTPHVNDSDIVHTPYKNRIVYGIGSVKGVGAKALDTILCARPYTSVEDFIAKVNEYDKIHKDKKTVNKTAIKNLIKAGAFSFEDENRNMLLNKMYDLRKDKDERLIEDNYNKTICMEYELETLNVMLTHKPWFDEVEEGPISVDECIILSKTEKTDKNGRIMAFVKVSIEDSPVEVIVFSSSYSKFYDIFDNRNNKGVGNKISIKGKKENNKIIFKNGKMVG